MARLDAVTVRSSSLPLYERAEQVPRDLRSEAELRANGFVELGEPVAILTVGRQAGGAGPNSAHHLLLYSTAQARRLRGDDWARLPRRPKVEGRAATVMEELWAGESRDRSRVEPVDPTFGPVGRPVSARRPSLKTNPRRWLTDLFREDFVVIDTETTGLGARDEIIEIAAVVSDGSVLMQSLVRPKSARIQPAAHRVHGLSESDLATAPVWPEVVHGLLAKLDGRRVLAWNAPFDERLAVQTSKAWRLPHDLPPFECAMRAYARCRGVGHGAMGLQRAASVEGVIAGSQAHRGAEDAQLVVALLRRLLDAPPREA